MLEIGLYSPTESVFASHLGDQLDLSAGQVNRGRRGHQVGDIRAELNNLSYGALPREHLIDAGHAFMVIDPEGRGCVALWIKVNDQDLGATLGQRSGNIDRGRGLADTTLLVGNGDDAGHSGHPRPAGSPDVSRETAGSCCSR